MDYIMISIGIISFVILVNCIIKDIGYRKQIKEIELLKTKQYEKDIRNINSREFSTIMQ